MGETYFQRVAKGSLYYFIGAVLAAGIAYLTRLLLVHNLSVEDYGLFYAVFTFVLFFAIFRELGMSQGLAKLISEYKAKKKYREIKSLITGATTTQFIVSLVFVAIFWIIAPHLSTSYFGDERATLLLRMLSLYLPLSIIFVNYTSIFRGFQNTKLYALSQPTLNFFVLLIVYVGLAIGIGIYAPVYGYILSLVLFFILFTWFILKEFNLFKYKAKNTKIETKKLLLFSLPLIATGAGALIINYFDTLMLTYFTDLEQVGIYNIIYPTAMIIGTIGVSIGTILMPVISELWVKKKKKNIVTGMKIIYKYIFTLTLPLIVGLIAFSAVFINLFFGEEYLPGDLAFKIILVGVIFNIMFIINKMYLIGIGLPKKVMTLYIYGAGFNVIANLVLIPIYGLNGAAFATAMSFLLMMIVSLKYVTSTIKIKVPIKGWFVTILASLVFLVVARIIPRITDLNIWTTIFLILIIAGIAYLIIMILTKTIDIPEIKSYVEEIRK